MKILLVSPPHNFSEYMGKLAKQPFIIPPFGLLAVAGWLEKNGIDVLLFDFLSPTDDDFPAVLRDYMPDIAGISCQTATVYSTLKLAEEIKELSPGATVVVGGVHPSLRPSDLIQSPAIDYAVRGEGEITMLEISQRFPDRSAIEAIPGVSYLAKDGSVVNNPLRETQVNLTEQYTPPYKLLSRYTCSMGPDTALSNKVAAIMTSRGCPFDCIFCANRMLAHGKWQARKIDSVMEEIDFYVDSHQIGQLFIADDNFCVNKKNVREFCDAFMRRGYHRHIKWWVEARIDCVDQDSLQHMYDAGCRIVSYGLESGVQRLLDLIQKNTTIEMARNVVEMTHKIGCAVNASLILGLPTETPEESQQTIDFAKSLPLNSAKFCLATPYPGTKLWDMAIAEGAFDEANIDWRRFSILAGYTNHPPMYAPRGRTVEEMMRLQRRAHRAYFLQPRVILHYLKSIKSPQVLFQYGRAALALIHPGK